MSLQYRLDIGDAWTVFPGGVMPVQYISSTQVGDEVAFGPVSLPLELENQPHVQILWRYHYLSGTGSRSEIRLDDVVLYSARTYQEWVADSLTAGEAGDPAVSGPLVEYLNDGHANLLKYALGVSPSAPVTTDQLEMGIKPDGRLFARFHLDRTLSDITYRLEVSPDLLDWSELAFDSQDFWEANSDGSMHEVIVPAGVELRKFIRLSIQSK